MRNVCFKKALVVGIIILFIGMCVNPSASMNVDEKSKKPISDGNTLYVGGSGPGNYTKIQDAINDAFDGDTVFVYDDSSPYYENRININKSINLIGQDKNTTIIKNNDTGIILEIRANHVTIQGFHIQNTEEKGSGIKSNTKSHNIIKDNIITESFRGIWLDDNDQNNNNYNQIIGNIISNNSHGIYTIHLKHGIISDNVISNCWEPLQQTNLYPWFGTYGNKISGNTLIDNHYGIRISGAYDNEIFENIVMNSGIGITLDNCEDSFIRNNHFEQNSAYGIHIVGTSRNNLVENNIIINNGRFGIDIRYSYDNIIKHNHIADNKNLGISIYDSPRTKVLQNNIIEKRPKFMYYRMDSVNDCKSLEFSENYWNKPRLIPKLLLGFWLKCIFTIPIIPGLDLDFNIPIPVPLFDLNPAKEPYDI